MDFQKLSDLWQQSGFETPLNTCIYINSQKQTLSFFVDQTLCKHYVISTAKNGLGNQLNSFKTPTGFHQIEQKIGADQPLNMIFKGRKASGEIAQVNVEPYSSMDTITSRILWLSGLQKDINLAGCVDTQSRYIYIHGTADETNLGQAVSHGCIRMSNKDVVELFDLVDEHATVYIA